MSNSNKGKKKQFKRVLAMDFDGSELEKQYWHRIEGLCEEKILISSKDDSFEKYLKETDCLLVKIAAVVDKDLIDKAPNLKYVGVLATGYGGVDAKYLANKGATLCNVADYATQGVAEITFGMIFNHIRNLGRGLAQAKSGDYSEAGFSGSEIRGKSFGVIGMGNIGVRTAEIANAFGANVQYWSRNRKPEVEDKGVIYKELEEILKTSDFISINLAYEKETEGFFNAERIQMIKKGAVVVNLSPMELVDINALAQRLSMGDMTFILDHADEMAIEDIDLIKKYPNCIIQLPIGYTTHEAKTVKQGAYVKSMEDYLSGGFSSKVN